MRPQRHRAWQQQTIGIILIAIVGLMYVVARYHHALFKGLR